MPLTHVCKWTAHGWKRISINDAVHEFPDTGVAARSGFFMCELCGEYVTLTNGEKNSRYFRHSNGNVECPEKTTGPSVSMDFQESTRSLPIRLNVVSSNHFGLELGLLAPPSTSVNKMAKRHIIIRPSENSEKHFDYLLERLNDHGITYLSIGNKPAKRYNVSLSPFDSKLASFWPKTIAGIECHAIFDSQTRKMLPRDADVQIGKEYLLLTRESTNSYKTSLRIKNICTVKGDFNHWRIYKIKATQMDENTARFFLKYHCRLTDNPVNLYPLWPIHIQTPYVIHHGAPKISIFFMGNANYKVYPATNSQPFLIDGSKLVTIQCEASQQLVALGRANILKYTYLRRQSLNLSMDYPISTFKTMEDKPIDSGSQENLPLEKTIKICLPFDGFVLIKNKTGFIIRRVELKATRELLLDKINWGMEIQVYQGLDCVWTASYFRNENIRKDYFSENEMALLKRLENCRGKNTSIPYGMGGLVTQLNDYPQIKQWLYKKLRTGSLSEQALRILQTYFTRKGKA